MSTALPTAVVASGVGIMTAMIATDCTQHSVVTAGIVWVVAGVLSVVFLAFTGAYHV